MSDLISRSKVISVLKQLEEHSLSGKMDISNAIYLIENQPTSYDIDKVVEEFDKKYNNSLWIKGDEEFSITRNELIEIVNQFGISDDVCEWKQDNMFETIYRVCDGFYTTVYQKDFEYCPYCGKKIKVVGD